MASNIIDYSRIPASYFTQTIVPYDGSIFGRRVLNPRYKTEQQANFLTRVRLNITDTPTGKEFWDMSIETGLERASILSWFDDSRKDPSKPQYQANRIYINSTKLPLPNPLPATARRYQKPAQRAARRAARRVPRALPHGPRTKSSTSNNTSSRHQSLRRTVVHNTASTNQRPGDAQGSSQTRLQTPTTLPSIGTNISPFGTSSHQSTSPITSVDSRSPSSQAGSSQFPASSLTNPRDHEIADNNQTSLTDPDFDPTPLADIDSLTPEALCREIEQCIGWIRGLQRQRGLAEVVLRTLQAEMASSNVAYDAKGFAEMQQLEGEILCYENMVAGLDKTIVGFRERLQDAKSRQADDMDESP